MTTSQTPFMIRRANDRGHANHGWLDSHHTFSFANYYDPEHMGFRSLRVINEDRVAPRGGFPEHPHRDMEIFSYVVEGQLAHQDNMGNRRILETGQIQLMSAGSGVTHSEFNPSQDQAAHFLQIWLLPRERGLPPSYTEWTPGSGKESEVRTLVISSDGRDGSARIAQDADIFRLLIPGDGSVEHVLQQNRGLWLQVIKGQVAVNDEILQPGDALSSETPGTFKFSAASGPVEALLFDLA